jgi:hypothetical protein
MESAGRSQLAQIRRSPVSIDNVAQDALAPSNYGLSKRETLEMSQGRAGLRSGSLTV